MRFRIVNTSSPALLMTRVDPQGQLANEMVPTGLVGKGLSIRVAAHRITHVLGAAQIFGERGETAAADGALFRELRLDVFPDDPHDLDVGKHGPPPGAIISLQPRGVRADAGVRQDDESLFARECRFTGRANLRDAIEGLLQPCEMVPRTGIEPVTPAFSVLCSTD